MKRVECRTQTECDDALKAGQLPILVGDGWFVAWGSSHVVARESSHVVAWGSSHVVAWGSSHVEARGSSHVEAWGSSHVVAWESSHVEAWGSSHVEAWGSSHVVASPLVAVHQHSQTAQVVGGVVIVVDAPKTPEAWCAYYGIPITDGVAVLYKAVRGDYRSAHGTSYTPGTQPEALDWDGGKAECGGGLHFAFHPTAARDFDSVATRYVACPVALSDIAVHPHPNYPGKVKARCICGPIIECDHSGKPLQAETKAMA